MRCVQVVTFGAIHPSFPGNDRTACPCLFPLHSKVLRFALANGIWAEVSMSFSWRFLWKKMNKQYVFCTSPTVITHNHTGQKVSVCQVSSRRSFKEESLYPSLLEVDLKQEQEIHLCCLQITKIWGLFITAAQLSLSWLMRQTELVFMDIVGKL